MAGIWWRCCCYAKSKAYEDDSGSDVVALARAAQCMSPPVWRPKTLHWVIWREVPAEESVTKLLPAVVNRMLEGRIIFISFNTSCTFHCPASEIVSSTSGIQVDNSSSVWHSTSPQTTPIVIHAETLKWELADKLCHLCLSVSVSYVRTGRQVPPLMPQHLHILCENRQTSSATYASASPYPMWEQVESSATLPQHLRILCENRQTSSATYASASPYPM